MENSKVPVPSSVSSTVSEVTSLSMAKIKLDSNLQVRVGLSEATIKAYTKDMRDDAEFPPIDVFHDGTDYWLANGFHRYSAADRIKLEEIAAYVHLGSKRDALLFAINADNSVGLRRSNEDKNKAVSLLLADDEWKTWSDGKLARQAGVSDRFVAKLRKKTTPNGSENKSIKYIKEGEEREMKLAQKQRAQTSESESKISEVPVREAVAVNRIECSKILETKDVRSDEINGKMLTDIKEAMVKDFSRRKMSDLEMLAIDFSDALDAILSEEELPSRNEISAVGDVEVLAKRFLDKFSKGEV